MLGLCLKLVHFFTSHMSRMLKNSPKLPYSNANTACQKRKGDPETWTLCKEQGIKFLINHRCLNQMWKGLGKTPFVYSFTVGIICREYYRKLSTNFWCEWQDFFLIRFEFISDWFLNFYLLIHGITAKLMKPFHIFKILC